MSQSEVNALALSVFLPRARLPASPFRFLVIDDALARLRVALLEEEVSEFVTASEKGDLIGITDALADIVYVVYGTALT
jgi:predicted HAD superfamily Cof-like phosphohydrolase